MAWIAGLVGSMTSESLVGLVMLMSRIWSWPPPVPGPPWIYFIGGVGFAIPYLLISFFLAPAGKWIVAIVVGVVTALFFWSVAFFAGPLKVTLYPASINWAAVSGICAGLILAGALLGWCKRTSSRVGGAL